MLVELKRRTRAREIIYQFIVAALDKLIDQKACSWVRIAFERVIFIHTQHNEAILFGEEPWFSFVKRDVLTIHPFIKNYMNEQVWLDFFDKYQLMSKEFLLVCLRNPSRQHRGAKRFCKD